MKNYYKVVFYILFVVLLNGCRGDQQNKLIGSWRQISFTEPTTTETLWQFSAGDALWLYTITDEVIIDSMHYSYGITGSTFDIFEGIDNPEYAPATGDVRGQYWVDILGKENFKITKRKHPDGTTGGAYLRIELVKK